MGDKPGHEFHGNQFTEGEGKNFVDPRGIAKSLDEATRATAEHEAGWRARGKAIPTGATLKKSGRKVYTLTDVGGDRFWIPEKGHVIADSAALTEFGKPYRELVESHETGLAADGTLRK